MIDLKNHTKTVDVATSAPTEYASEKNAESYLAYMENLVK